MSNLPDRLGAPRRSAFPRNDFSALLAAGLAGLAVGALLAAWLATDPVLLFWLNPV